MKLVVVGAGYVGLATAVGLAREGHQIELVDADPRRASVLRQGRLPFHEPFLAAELTSALGRGLVVNDAYHQFGNVDFAFICVETDGQGGPLLTHSVEAAAFSLAKTCPTSTGIVIRSTLNPGTAVNLSRMLRAEDFTHEVLVNPEFLREGSALSDFIEPSRHLIGAEAAASGHLLATLYAFTRAPVFETDPTTAELTKLVSNAALAVRVSLANEIASLALGVGADIELLLAAVGADPRIGSDYLKPGLGFGGYCLPKDLDALRSQPVFTPILDAAAAGNVWAMERVIEPVLEALAPGSSVTVVGVGFKPGSDSIRGSKALILIERLLCEGFRVTVCDPLAEMAARKAMGDLVSYSPKAQLAAEHSDGMILVHAPPADEAAHLVGLVPYIWDDLGRPYAPPTKEA